MIGNLYVLKNDGIKSCYRSHYFLCLGHKSLCRGFSSMKQFVNIKSGTIVESAIWNSRDIEKVDITEDHQIQIDNVLKKKKTRDFLIWLENK